MRQSPAISVSPRRAPFGSDSLAVALVPRTLKSIDASAAFFNAFRSSREKRALIAAWHRAPFARRVSCAQAVAVSSSASAFKYVTAVMLIFSLFVARPTPHPVRAGAKSATTRTARRPPRAMLDVRACMSVLSTQWSGVAGVCTPGAGREWRDRPGADQGDRSRERDRDARCTGFQALERSREQHRVELAGL